MNHKLLASVAVFAMLTAIVSTTMLHSAYAADISMKSTDTTKTKNDMIAKLQAMLDEARAYIKALKDKTTTPKNPMTKSMSINATKQKMDAMKQDAMREKYMATNATKQKMDAMKQDAMREKYMATNATKQKMDAMKQDAMREKYMATNATKQKMDAMKQEIQQKIDMMKKENPQATKPSTTLPMPVTKPTTTPVSSDVTVEMAKGSSTDQKCADKCFVPSTVNIKVGGTVTWKNMDTAAHTVTDSKGAFDSSLVNAGASFKQKFNTAGTYSYTCIVHPWMKGTVTVS
jgi:plastocyanin